MKNKKYLSFVVKLGALSLAVMPMISFADYSCKDGVKSGSTLGGFINYITDCLILGAAIRLIFALALAMFLWGVVQYVINSDEEAKKAQGRQFMIWGIIALFVMTSIWGLVNIIGGTFGFGKAAVPTLPTGQ